MELIWLLYRIIIIEYITRILYLSIERMLIFVFINIVSRNGELGWATYQ